MRALCIRNPAAGRQPVARGGVPAEAWPEVLRILEEAGFDLETVETGNPGPTAAELAARAVREGLPAVFVAGGDGSVALAATKLLGGETVLGILPFGSVMNIANSIDLPLEPVAAARVLAERHVRRIDVGEVNGHYFFEAAGVGLDADAFGAARAAERGRWRQALRRVRRAFSRRSHRLEIVLDGAERHEYRALQVLVQNGRYYAWSFPVVPEADVEDGRLDVAVFPRMGRVELIASLVAAWRGRPPQTRPVVLRGAEVEIRSRDRVPAHADGVIVGNLPLTFRCRRGALAVLGPRRA